MAVGLSIEIVNILIKILVDIPYLVCEPVWRLARQGRRGRLPEARNPVFFDVWPL